MRLKGWFGSKRIGYGVSPRGWEGWLATAVFTAAIVADVRWFHPRQFGLAPWTRAASELALGALFLLVIWLTYDPDT